MNCKPRKVDELQTLESRRIAHLGKVDELQTLKKVDELQTL